MSKPVRSLRAAIDAMCKACIYDPIGGNGTWRQQTEGCTAKHCQMWQFRPVSRAGGEISATPLPGQGITASAPPGEAERLKSRARPRGSCDVWS